MIPVHEILFTRNPFVQGESYMNDLLHGENTEYQILKGAISKC